MTRGVRHEPSFSLFSRSPFVIRQEAKTPIDYVRRGTLYGAAFGMLAGLAAVTIHGDTGREAIAVWRNWIVACAVVGLAIGSIRAIMLQSRFRHIERQGEPPA